MLAATRHCSRTWGAMRQVATGIHNTIGRLFCYLGKSIQYLSRAHTVHTRHLGSNRVEIVFTPNPGVQEKPFQCENRMGALEAVAKVFTAEIASLEHPVCIHRGGDSCRYIISWKTSHLLIWKRIRNYVALSAFVICPVLFMLLHKTAWAWAVPVLIYALLVSFFLYYSEHVEKKILEISLKSQAELANSLLDEINMRHNNAVLIQEIGQAASMILDSKKLLKLVTEAMQKRLDFDRGMIMLADEEETHLIYTAGYGYNPEDEEYLTSVEFNLDKPQSKGPAVESFRMQKPILIDDISKIADDLSKRTQKFAKMIGAKSFVCVPIVFENKSLGVLMVDNIKSKRPLTQSDVSLLMGIATQIAISKNNATSYQKVLESEERFRSLSENAPDIIYTLDINGSFTYINPLWEKILGHHPDEVIGRKFIDFMRTEDARDYAVIFEQVRDGKLILRDRSRHHSA